ncbi:hypothetical protein GCM10023210_34960 [Chryseobacterium ginsengisoli]|uniref:Uncharacterized protein n=1 Tax=Chryseobacterium ginsengisoli TaxID=363853 RepID=A0ABP9MRL1_9FLAO
MGRFKVYFFASIVVVILLATFIFLINKKEQKIEGKPFENQIKTVKGKKNDSLLIFEKFVKDFNSHKADNIDKYIDPELGMMLFYHDGPYPILKVTSTIKDEIDWFNQDIFENVAFENSPDYLGDFEFSKTGFFVTKNKGNFSLKKFDDSYTSHPESFFKENKKIETLCNFSATGITKGKSKTFEFYFRFDGKKLTLLGLSTDSVSDVMFGDPKTKVIPFGNKNDIENYFKNQKLFRDKEQNAYIDFDKKEITYYDFPNDPFVFEYFEIGEIKDDSDKIKSVELIFYPDKSNKENGFFTYFSNKGSFVVPPMGARPPYFYEPVKK